MKLKWTQKAAVIAVYGIGAAFSAGVALIGSAAVNGLGGSLRLSSAAIGGAMGGATWLWIGLSRAAKTLRTVNAHEAVEADIAEAFTDLEAWLNSQRGGD